MALPVENQLSDQLDSLERRIHMLKVEYEKYFLGVLKKPPTKEYEELATAFRNLAKQTIRNTAQNFRYQTLKARFVTFDQYWQRILKQIEDGTFKRDQFKYGLKQKEAEARMAEKKRLEEEQKSQEAQRLEEQRKLEEQKAAASTARELRDTIADERRMQSLYQDFVAKRKQCNERVDNVAFDKMVEFMKAQTQSIKQKYNARAVEFQVVVDEGKTKLKAVPVK